ncbi:MAG: hypothetical protein FWC43_01945 [Planctomycetaceae bacterium]|nr:hypothetical protein [Planctomycetaceae bacterium]
MTPFRAFTLIEVLLALLLMSVVMFMVGFAIDTNMRLLDSARTEVEETQLARALLEKIARDIRSVVVAKKEENLSVDTSIFDSMWDSYGIDPSLLSQSGLTNTFSAETSSETESTTDFSEVPESGTVVGTMPGIYGSSDWIQIDTGRLPRGETYKTSYVLAEGSILGDRSSPTKTAFYYIGKDTGMLSVEESTEERISGSLGLPLDRYGVQYGLYRRLRDRYVCKYAEENNLDYEYGQYDEALAPEVEGIEFWYYDTENEEWIDYWDMDEIGYLPSAVRVILHIRKKLAPRSTVFRMFGSSGNEIPILTYSTVVPMPLSFTAPLPQEETEENQPQSEPRTE